MKKQTERGEDGIVKVKPKRGYPPMRNGCVNEGAGGWWKSGPSPATFGCVIFCKSLSLSGPQFPYP